MEIRNNNFRLQLQEGSVKEYEKIILSEVNDVFIPMGFVSSGEGETILYNCSGYAALKQCEIVEACEALEILEKTFLQIGRASEYLITPSKITLSMETIFYNRQTRQVRIAYVPVKRTHPTLRENMSGFIAQMGKSINKKDKTYLDQIKNQMEENNYYIQDMINVIGEMRRSISSDRRMNLEGALG